MPVISAGAYSFCPLSRIEGVDRSEIQISPQSKFSDLSWDLSGFDTNPNAKPSLSVLSFSFKMKDGSRFSDTRYDSLREAFKELIYGMAATPAGTLPSPGTLKARYTDVRFLMYWLANRNIYSLSEMTREDANQFIIEVRNQEDVHPGTRRGRLQAVRYFWQYRRDVTNALGFDPLRKR